MLLASRDIIGGNKWVEDNKADENIQQDNGKSRKRILPAMKLKAKNLVLLVLVQLVCLVANAAVALGMEVYGYDPFISVDGAWKLIKRQLNMSNTREEIYKECDFITVHTPLIR